MQRHTSAFAALPFLIAYLIPIATALGLYRRGYTVREIASAREMAEETVGAQIEAIIMRGPARGKRGVRRVLHHADAGSGLNRI